QVRVFPSEYLVSRLRNYVVFVITIIPLQIICIYLEFCESGQSYRFETWSYGCTASFPLTASFLGVICALVFKNMKIVRARAAAQASGHPVGQSSYSTSVPMVYHPSTQQMQMMQHTNQSMMQPLMHPYCQPMMQPVNQTMMQHGSQPVMQAMTQPMTQHQLHFL
ncbi:unnamed protein product, partial [Meganyctiphanes norvegica]